jgi:hypothetical protein
MLQPKMLRYTLNSIIKSETDSKNLIFLEFKLYKNL